MYYQNTIQENKSYIGKIVGMRHDYLRTAASSPFGGGSSGEIGGKSESYLEDG